LGNDLSGQAITAEAQVARVPTPPSRVFSFSRIFRIARLELGNMPARWRSGRAHGQAEQGVMSKKRRQQSRRSPTTRSPLLGQRFSEFARIVSQWTGNPDAFLIAVAVVLVWLVTGPLFNYSDTWQLVINTGTTIVTFLMVFLIQNTQNRDTLAIQLKLSELVLAMKGAENKFAAIEDLADGELEKLHDECRARTEMTSNQIESRKMLRGKSRNSQPFRDDANPRRPSS
jgi:low affinity Fe/Cu permease